jgi:aconitate hydratase
VKADEQEFTVTVRIDTPKEQRYFHHGGILQFVLRELLSQES